MNTQEVNNKRIAKNTSILYLRMGLILIVGLYTGRIVLQTLGVENYGIYGVVGGVVGMFSFINASMSGATSRFLTYELGKGNGKKLKDTFSSALLIHITIALLILFLSETMGLWFLDNKLVIPPERMYAASWVFQFSIFTAMFSIFQVPYVACLIAHERMNVYAYVEILNTFLKLFIVYLIQVTQGDKLIFYALLLLIVSLLVTILEIAYCMKNFRECEAHFIWDTSVIKPMLSFSVWDLYGNLCITAKIQGNNFLINMFFGVTLNASSSIATTVNNIVMGFCGNVIQAFRPQIIKQYSIGNIHEMQNLMNAALKYMIILMCYIMIPLFLEMHYILTLWLGKVPYLADQFCKILLLTNLLGLINSIITIGIHATGKIKRLSFITGSLFMLSVPSTYILFKLGFGATSAYLIMIFIYVGVIASNMAIIKRNIPTLNLNKYIHELVRTCGIMSLIFCVSLFLYYSMHSSFLRLSIICCINFLLISVITYLFFIDKPLRNKINHYICQKLA